MFTTPNPQLQSSYEKAKNELNIIKEKMQGANNQQEINKWKTLKAQKEQTLQELQKKMDKHIRSKEGIDLFLISTKLIDAALQNILLLAIHEDQISQEKIRTINKLGYYDNIPKAEMKRIEETLFFRETGIFPYVIEVLQKDHQWALDYHWVMDEECEWDMSFEQCCNICKMNAYSIRKMIKDHVEEESLEEKIIILQQLRHFTEIKHNISLSYEEEEELCLT